MEFEEVRTAGIYLTYSRPGVVICASRHKGAIVGRDIRSADTVQTKSRAAAIRGFQDVVEALGGDYRRVACEAGLDLADIAHDDALMPTTIAKAVLDGAARETGCDHFGLLLAEQRDQGSYLGLLGRIIQTAPTVAIALEEGFDLSGLHSEASLWQLHKAAEVSFVTYSLLEGLDGGSKQIQQLAITVLWHVMRAITQRRWHPTMLSFTFRKPTDLAPYRRVFDVPIMFEGDFCGVVFHSADLEIQLPTSDRELHDMLQRHARQLRSGRRGNIADQVRVLIRKNLDIQKVGEETITQFLPFERRTLQRKLKDEGTGYRQLLGEVRLEMAKELLRESDISITRIAERLSYSGVATMTRAFKAQTGFSPSAWRENRRGLGTIRTTIAEL